MLFEHLQGWGLHHFPGQPVPMLDHSFSEEIFPDIQSKPPLMQLEAISPRLISSYLGEETNTCLTTTSNSTSPLPPYGLYNPNGVSWCMAASSLLHRLQPTPRMPALPIWAGGLAAHRGNMEFGAAWRTGHLWKLSALQVFTFLPREAGACCRPGCMRAAGSFSDRALAMYCSARKTHASAPAGCPPSAGVSGAMKTHSSRKATPLCFLCPPCSPTVFIILCVETDLLIPQLLQALLPSATESKPTCANNQPTKK